MLRVVCTAVLIGSVFSVCSVSSVAVSSVNSVAQSTDPRPDFSTFVEGLRADALARGISEATVDRALTGLEPSPSVIERDQTQAEAVLTVDQYVARRLTRPFVRTARRMAAKHEALLRRVSSEYGVSARVIVSSGAWNRTSGGSAACGQPFRRSRRWRGKEDEGRSSAGS